MVWQKAGLFQPSLIFSSIRGASYVLEINGSESTQAYFWDCYWHRRKFYYVCVGDFLTRLVNYEARNSCKQQKTGTRTVITIFNFLVAYEFVN